jgi:hypothetical protein
MPPHHQENIMRPSGRAPDEMRAIFIETAFTKHAEGSVLIGFGDTPRTRAPPASKTGCRHGCAARVKAG